MASAAAQLLSLFFALYSLGAAQQWSPVTVPSSNPTTVYPPAITIPAIFPPPQPLTFPLPPQSWCVARPGAMVAAVQVALDYACSSGADCSAIQPAGSCFIPNTLQDHASYAFNSYYQRNPSPASCNFGGVAILISINPSTPTCQYPTSYQTPPVNTYTPVVSIPSPPTGYANLPTPISNPSPPTVYANLPTPISNPSPPFISNPTGTGAVFGPNNPLGSSPTNSGSTSSSPTMSSSNPAGREPTSLSKLILLIVSVFISRWQLLGAI